MCLEKGTEKKTYGKDCFMVMNTGEKAVTSRNKLQTTIEWKVGDKVNYALEGSVFIGGAVIQWLRDELNLLMDAAESERMATSVENNDGVYLDRKSVV